MLWLFCFFPPVKFRPLPRVPLLLTAVVVGLTLLLRLLNPDFIERLEWVTYDQRARAAASHQAPVATNLGFVFLDDETIRAVAAGDFGYRYGLYWPRQVFGRAVEELAAQGAKFLAFDVIFGELRHDHPLAQLPSGELVESDEFLAIQMRRAGNVALAMTPDVEMPELFRTNAAYVADITTERDADGVLRRVRVLREVREWHSLFLAAEAQPDFGICLRDARVEPDRIVLPTAGGEEVIIKLDAGGRFHIADFVGEKIPPGMAATELPFTTRRVWHMGVVIAAKALGLDLAQTEVDLKAGRVVLRGTNNLERVVPVDGEGHFLIDWSLPVADPRLTVQPMQHVLEREFDRSQGRPSDIPALWRDKLVVIGSAVSGGNDLTDRGATPLERDTLLVSKHWNVANSIIMGRYVHRLGVGTECSLIVVLGLITALATWRLRALLSVLALAVLLAGYVSICFWMFNGSRLWLPMILPVAGAILLNWAGLTAWRVFFEQAERRRVRSVFSRIVSPNIVRELLEQKSLALGGARRREVTVFFADVRGFTEFTDVSHQLALQHIQTQKLDEATAAAYLDRQAGEALDTVNLYLARVADTVKLHEGTLDKYIGDCVMAFWGAPTPNARHAVSAVRAAMDAQRAVHALNLERGRLNENIKAANQQRQAAGQPLQSLHPLLQLGSGINTGLATVGLMGSDAHLLNYTVFGREVNVASRLESASGRGRIIISEATYRSLLRDDVALAGQCIELPPVEVKGIREAIKIYEVPWQAG